MQQWELFAREAVRDLVARYNGNGDSGRIDVVLELFAPNAVMEVTGTTYTGRDAIRGRFMNASTDLATPAIQHHTSTLQIELVDEQHARARSYFQVLMGAGLDHWGRYTDEFGVVDGRWLFTRRKVTVTGTAPGG